MPELSTEAINDYWRHYKDPMIQRIVAFMEMAEHWTPDGNSAVEAALERLGRALDNIDNLDLGEPDAFIEITNQLKTGRSLRLLQILDLARPGAASKILIHAENRSEDENDMHGLFLRRNIVFERLRLLSRIFSPERFNLILKALESDETDN